MYRFALLSLTFGVSLAVVACRANDAWACYVEYVLKEHDTLQSIAHQIYNDQSKWQIIYWANQDRLAEHRTLVRPGTSIRLPCTAGNVAVPEDKPIAGSVARKEPQDVIVPFHLTSTDGVGRKIGFIHARNTRMSVGAREEIALVLSPNLEGLPPGPHAFHVHSNPNCGPGEADGKVVPGLAAGPHLFLKGTGHESGVTYTSSSRQLAQSPRRQRRDGKARDCRAEADAGRHPRPLDRHPCQPRRRIPSPGLWRCALTGAAPLLQ